MSYGYIYKITNTINNKSYVGLHKAEKFDSSYFGSGVLIKKAIEKYGKENFIIEILDWAQDREELNTKEKYWITELDTQIPKGYNIAQGGDGGDIFSQLSPERQQKVREKLSKSLKGRTISEETREKHRQNMLGENNHMYGKHLSDETKRKISEKLKGENNPMYGVPSPMTGKHLSEETKEKIRQSKLGEKNPMYGRHLSNEEKAIRSEMFSGEKNPRAISCVLYCYENNEKKEFSYIKEALDYLGISQAKYYKDKKQHSGIMYLSSKQQHYFLIRSDRDNKIPPLSSYM